MKKLTEKDFEEKIKKVHPNEDLKVVSYGGDKKDSEVYCTICGTHYIKKSGSFTDKRKISICKNCFPTHTNTLKEDFMPPNDYELVEPYKGMHNKIKVRHSCGFIWEITPNNLKLGKGCPKCNKKVSKGERKIEEWLIENNINFVKQKKVIIDNHNLFMDFFLPDLDLYIEYNGEQHYESIEFFGGEEKFKKQVKLDKLKKDFFLNKLIIISYKDFQEIENILKSSTTIPIGSRP